jgi:hypothetical protein
MPSGGNYVHRPQLVGGCYVAGNNPLIILVIALLGGFSGFGGGPFYGTGYYGGGGLGLALVIVAAPSSSNPPQRIRLLRYAETGRGARNNLVSHALNIIWCIFGSGQIEQVFDERDSAPCAQVCPQNDQWRLSWN